MGINSSSDIYQCEMAKYFGHINNLIIWFDFFVFGSTEVEHDETLLQILDTARKVFLKLNKDKCIFKTHSLSFLGNIFTDKGVLPDLDRVSAIRDMKPPSSVIELQRFMGVVNYIGPFIKNLSGNISNLKKLLQKDIVRFWDKCHQAEFDHLKSLVTNCPVLTCFNPDEPVTLSVDASKDALGAVLLQNNKPIACVSTTLTLAHCNYSHIEKVLIVVSSLIIIFTPKLLMWRLTTNLLLPLLKKPPFKVPHRLQRLIPKLQRYTVNLMYVPGKYMYIADTLSHSAVSEDKSFTAMEKSSMKDMGIERYQQHARGSVFWPGINNDIRVLVNNCQDCQKCKGNQIKMSFIPH
ncbi:hypothetical protein PR048_013572 [Dryococelus australis]|uniref:RNA-directed DNA polymerase n=1 Tax=Dryococelus australis TaxID=614101 RepID=A0ABQ9HSJ2_9NEOP|nr:hypothetical protein PR048_013572 [Dryococelus australis]